MITKQAHNDNIRVEEYGFAEWLAQVEPLLRDGYKFDFVTNENFPVGYGQMYTATLVPNTAVLVPVTAKTEVLVGKKETTVVTTDVAPSATFNTPSEITVDEITPVYQTKRKNAKN